LGTSDNYASSRKVINLCAYRAISFRGNQKDVFPSYEISENSHNFQTCSCNPNSPFGSSASKNIGSFTIARAIATLVVAHLKAD
jgi:hypothetical protein